MLKCLKVSDSKLFKAMSMNNYFNILIYFILIIITFCFYYFYTLNEVVAINLDEEKQAFIRVKHR